MHFLTRGLIGVFLLSVTFATLALAGWLVVDAARTAMSDEPEAAPPPERVFAVATVVADPVRVEPVLEAFGVIQSRRTLQVRATQDGRVVWLSDSFVDGGAVAAGDLLARLDPAEATAALAIAKADLAAAEAELADALRAVGLAEDDLAVGREQAQLRAQALARQEDLSARGVGSTAAVETAALEAAASRQAVVSRRQALATAEARVQRAETDRERISVALSEAERALAETEIRAGFSGRLGAVSIVEGGLVARNERLAELVDPGALEAAARLSTAQYARLLGADGALAGLPVIVSHGSAQTRIFSPGRILRDSAVVAEGEAGRQVFVDLLEPSGFRPGDLVTLRITEPAIDMAVRLPATAVSPSGLVLYVGPDERLLAGTVTRLRSDGNSVIVAPGDLAGAQIVALRTPVLGPGVKVRVVPPPEPGSQDRRPVADSLGAAGVALSPTRRLALVDHVTLSNRFEPAEKARLLAILRRETVPPEIVARLERDMGI